MKVKIKLTADLPQVKIDRACSPDCYTECMSVEGYSSLASFCFVDSGHSSFVTAANFFKSGAAVTCSKPDSSMFST
jgi:hypothetical protein